MLCESIGIKISKVTVSRDRHYSSNYVFSIRSESILRFKGKIGFSHPEKHQKLETREKIIKRNKRQRTRPLKWTRTKILESLEKNPMSTMQLSEKLLLTVAGIYHHLNYLKENEYIEKGGHRNKIIWKLKLGSSPHNLPV